MAACHNQKNWFVPVSDALAGLTAEQASWNDGDDNHSIWQIVNHLIFWNERWLMRFRGEVPPKMEGENSGTFSGAGSEGEWKKTVKKLDEVLTEWETRLKETGDDVLEREAYEGYGDSWLAMLTQTTIHNAYHIGQIVTLRKQQGSWNPEQGVK
jgi:uncharacterized damage-inducible protein DinB